MAFIVVSVGAENMWSSYGPAAMRVEKKIESVAASEPTQDTSLPYILNDISTFFTLLVGIYFPSVTGKVTLTPPYLSFLFYFKVLAFSFFPLLANYTVH